MIEEFSKVNELPQATIEVEKSVVLHVKEEISNVEHCDLMRDKNIEKERIEIRENELYFVLGLKYAYKVNQQFGTKRSVFDPQGLGWGHLVFE
ncbi:hypothetical protein M9H77_17722 [Catharanthus roseus]|uniref:Uncharacterized protein n=1 Tax=Catharanthus roseus TaxID=4058 RepID=A0ACC0B5G7_CATRO|nr:hypothetical protein M9H77_17722 [Catharanthus roseus]